VLPWIPNPRRSIAERKQGERMSGMKG
jgi:hypothetical protein